MNVAESATTISLFVMMPSWFASLYERIFGCHQPLSGYPGCWRVVEPTTGGIGLPVASVPSVTSLLRLLADDSVTSQANARRERICVVIIASRPSFLTE